MPSYAGPAELIPDGGGKPLDVGVQLFSRKSRWGGHFVLTTARALPVDAVGSCYTIRLPNSREGTVCVSKVGPRWTEGEGHRRVDVLGSGPAPL